MGEALDGFRKLGFRFDSRALVKASKAFELALRRRGVDAFAQHS
ncbi:MAG: hypothetical protein RLZZ280_374, partial [Pseudomonadota bacterium]